MAVYGTMGNCSAALSATYSVTETPPMGFNNATISSSDTSQIIFSAGTSGAKAIDQHYEYGTSGSPVSLAANAAITLILSDLGTAPYLDKLQREIGFGHITGFWIRITNSAAANYLEITPGGTHGFALLTGATGVLRVKSFFMWVDDVSGLAVGSGATDQLVITAKNGTVTFLLGIIGTTG